MLSPRNKETIWLWAAALTIGLIITLLVATPASGQTVTVYLPADDQLDIVQPSDPVEEWRSEVADYFPSSVVDDALDVMACESGGDPSAVSATDDHGLFQHHDASYARVRFTETGWTWGDRYVGEANIAAAAWLWERDGWSPWTCQPRGQHQPEPRVWVDLISIDTRIR